MKLIVDISQLAGKNLLRPNEKPPVFKGTKSSFDTYRKPPIKNPL